MKKIRSILFLVIVFFSFQGCQTVKEGFTSQKKKSSDEFLHFIIGGLNKFLYFLELKFVIVMTPHCVDSIAE